MWAIEHHPEFVSTDFENMRAHYKDYLRLKNFDTKTINHFIKDFDDAYSSKNYNWIYERMAVIGAKII